MTSLVHTAAATIAAHGLFPHGAPVVAMVSGGADSVSLLRVLASGELGEFALTVLHVDHRLRGAESDADAHFVSALCDSLGVSCVIHSVDVAAYATEHGLNLEDAGRRVRYAEADRLLDELCAEAGVQPDDGRIATAHTFDDRAETVLMRLAQGTGAAGLLALPYRRGRIVRPLLDCTRRQILDYLRSIGQDWREDATNADTTRLRARVRADVLPVLRHVNPRFDDALARTLLLLGDEDELLEGMALDLAAAITEPNGAPDGREAGVDEIRIWRPEAASAPRALLRRALRRLVFDAFPEASRLEFEHLEAVCDAAGDCSFTGRHLPGGLRVHAEYATLVISRDAGPAAPLSVRELPIPGTIDLGAAGVITAEPGGERAPGNDPMGALIDADAVSGVLSVGPPREGDRMRPLGMTGSRKLQDVFTDAKVPARSRSRVPVIRDGDRIVWVAGVRLDDRFKVVRSTARTIMLTWVPADRGRTS